MAPDDCPFHSLSPDTTVWIGNLPYSAQLCCEDWHSTVGIRAHLARLVDEAHTNARGKAFWASQRA